MFSQIYVSFVVLEVIRLASYGLLTFVRLRFGTAPCSDEVWNCSGDEACDSLAGAFLHAFGEDSALLVLGISFENKIFGKDAHSLAL